MFGKYEFHLQAAKEELMISKDILDNEPKQVKSDITIGKSYLITNNQQIDMSSKQYTSSQPSSVV